MTHTADKENSEPSIEAIIHDMRKAWARTTAGEWGKGNTTHETVARGGREKEYRIAEFRHADDAAFCDLAHALTPRVCDELERQHTRITELKSQLTTASQLLQQMLAEFGRDGHGGEFEDGEHPLIDEVRAFLTGTPYAVRTKQARAWRIYIAGPMTGLPDLNFPAFNAAADELRNQGWHVENPADHGVIDGAQWEDYLAYDITRLGTCGAIYLLPGWEKSKGATLEAHIAKMLGLQVLLAPGAEDVQPLQKTVAAQQGVRQAYVLEDDGHETYLDGCESRFSIRRADGECVAWVAPLDKDSGEAVAREMIAALNAAHPTTQVLEIERLRNLLCKMVDQLERRGKHRDGNAPGHGHGTPGVWDRDNGELAGKRCAWCEVWQEALEVHAAAQAKQAANGKGWGGSGTSMIDGHDVAAPVQLPEPVAFALEWSFNGEERGMRLYDDETHCRFDAESDGGVCHPLYTEHQVRQLLAAHGIGKDKA